MAASCSIVQMMIQNIECIVRALHLIDTLGWMGHKHSLYLVLRRQMGWEVVTFTTSEQKLLSLSLPSSRIKGDRTLRGDTIF